MISPFDIALYLPDASRTNNIIARSNWPTLCNATDHISREAVGDIVASEIASARERWQQKQPQLQPQTSHLDVPKIDQLDPFTGVPDEARGWIDRIKIYYDIVNPLFASDTKRQMHTSPLSLKGKQPNGQLNIWQRTTGTANSLSFPGNP